MAPSVFAADHFTVRDLGRLAYGPALAEQRRVNDAVIAGETGPTVLLVEHEPVITISQRQAARTHLLASDQRLGELGIAVHETDRGGDVTYHGPGQLVVYPILRLNPLGLNLSRYMRLLEAAVIDALAGWGVRGERVDGATGVWVKGAVRGSGAGDRGSGTGGQPSALSPQASDEPVTPFGSEISHQPSDLRHAKVCAMGVRVRKNTTMHGLALNVNPDLSHFETIVPCGLTGSDVTSLHTLRGEQAPPMHCVKRDLLRQLDRRCAEAA